MIQFITKGGVFMLGERLKELRKNKAQTQEQVAKYLGISRAAYSHFENNRNEPDYSTLDKLANYYGVTTDYLLERNNTPQWADKRDTTDLKKFLDDDSGMTYDGDNLTEEENEQLRVALTQIFWKRRRAERKISRDTEENL